MKQAIIYIFTITLSLFMLQACGQEEAEVERDQQAVQDSLEQAYEAEMEQMRQDSIARAEADSIEEEEGREQTSQIEYDENGDFVVQIEAWRSEDKAQQQADEWIERGYDRSFVVMYGNEDTGDVWYRVRIGQFDTRDMAERLKSELEEEHDIRSWVSRADRPVQQEAMND